MQQPEYGTKKSGSFCTCLILGCLLWAGCGDKKPAALTETEVIRHRVRQEPLEATSLSVSGEKVTLADLMDLLISSNSSEIGAAPLGGILSAIAEKDIAYDEFQKQALPMTTHAVSSKITSILLYQKLKREAGDKLDEGLEKIAERDWRELVIEKGHGNEAEAEDLLRSQNMTRAKFKESRKRWYLTQFYIGNKMPNDRPIGHKEILDYFDRQKSTVFAKEIKITFRLIDIQPDRINAQSQAMDQVAAALEFAQDLKRQLSEGADFAELAKLHSHGHMARLGGLWPLRDPATLAPPFDILGRVAEQLEVGDISEPLIAADHVFIMKLEGRQTQGTKPLAEVQLQIESQIANDRQNEVLQPLQKELAERAEVGDIDTFVQSCLQNIYEQYHPSQG